MKNISLEFTGERLIPELNKGKIFFYEHLARYLFSCQFVKGKTVLDAATGTGYGAFILAKYGKAAKVKAVDKDEKTIEYAKLKYNHSNVEFLVEDIEKLRSVKNKLFDVVTAFEVIEHLNKPSEFLEQIKRVIKPQGILIISTPNKYAYNEGNPFHIKEFYPEEFKKLLQKFFRYVKFYYQVFEFTQIIKTEGGQNFELEEKFITNNQKVYTKPVEPKTYQYIIAICANRTLPSAKTLSINSNKVDNFDFSKGALSLSEQLQNQEFENLRLKLKEIQSAKTYKIWQAYCRIMEKLGLKK